MFKPGEKVFYMSTTGKLTAGEIVETGPVWLVVQITSGMVWNCRVENLFRRNDAPAILAELKRRQGQGRIYIGRGAVK
ncbi:MAG: hypothetical protein M3Y56_15455 [Armatimonadota bacterium]|nr:hypothetical protein [Armatimonadota bacterium]